jgi:hypothetical protein
MIHTSDPSRGQAVLTGLLAPGAYRVRIGGVGITACA